MSHYDKQRQEQMDRERYQANLEVWRHIKALNPLQEIKEEMAALRMEINSLKKELEERYAYKQ